MTPMGGFCGSVIYWTLLELSLVSGVGSHTNAHIHVGVNLQK